MQGLEDCIPLKYTKDRGGVRTASLEPKLRMRGSSIIPEGNKRE